MSNWLFPDRDPDGDPSEGDGAASADSAPANPATVDSPAAVDPAETGVAALESERFDPGTTMLIAGPAMTGKRRLLFDVLGGSADRAAALVSTKASADRVAEWFGATVPDADAWDLSVVDCTGGSEGTPGEGYELLTVSQPSDLTGIGIRLSGVMKRWHRADVADPRFGVHSLSTLLMYTDLHRVFRFVHVMCSRMRRLDGVCAFVLDTRSRSDDVYDRLVTLVDGAVEVRERDDGPQFRVRGLEAGPSGWTAY